MSCDKRADGGRDGSSSRVLRVERNETGVGKKLELLHVLVISEED
jgi:hypothetical protein